ncbi:MAG TPA: trimethylamine methyltransferase family protein [bacterium]|nr:trimethylamine methyltransferase family protein [bacterium]
MIPLMKLEVLDLQEMQQIHSAALRILTRTGVQVEHEGLCEKLSDFGASLYRGDQRVRFPESLVERFLAESTAFDYTSVRPSVTGQAGVYQGLYLEPESNSLVHFTEKTLADYVKLARLLDNVTGIHILNYPVAAGSPTEPLELLVFAWKYGADVSGSIQQTFLCPYLFEMYSIQAETTGKSLEEVFRGGVFLISPLRFPAHEAEQLMYFHDKGLRVWMANMITAGGTGPVTLAGCVALNIAEAIFMGIVNRTLFGDREWRLDCNIAPIDMRTMIQPYGRPEMLLANLATLQMARYYRVAGGGHCGLTDAKIPSQEAGSQKLLTALPCVLAGGGNIEPGLLSIDEVFSPIQMIIDAEVVGAIRRVLAGFEVTEETLAVDVINAIGPGGFFTATEHTVAHFRKEQWEPSVWSREMVQTWLSQGGKTDVDRALNIWKDIMTKPDLEPGITPETEHRLRSVIEQAKRGISKKAV